MEASSRLRELTPGQTLACEVKPDQESRLARVAEVRGADLVDHTALPSGRLLITLRKRQGEAHE